jgi:porphobilinogen deaminase
VGAHARALDGGELELTAWVGLPDGSAWLCDELRGDGDASPGLGLVVAERLMATGAAELLREAEAQVV